MSVRNSRRPGLGVLLVLAGCGGPGYFARVKPSVELLAEVSGELAGLGGSLQAMELRVQGEQLETRQIQDEVTTRLGALGSIEDKVTGIAQRLAAVPAGDAPPLPYPADEEEAAVHPRPDYLEGIVLNGDGGRPVTPTKGSHTYHHLLLATLELVGVGSRGTGFVGNISAKDIDRVVQQYAPESAAAPTTAWPCRQASTGKVAKNQALEEIKHPAAFPGWGDSSEGTSFRRVGYIELLQSLVRAFQVQAERGGAATIGTYRLYRTYGGGNAAATPYYEACLQVPVAVYIDLVDRELTARRGQIKTNLKALTALTVVGATAN